MRLTELIVNRTESGKIQDGGPIVKGSNKQLVSQLVEKIATKLPLCGKLV
jgi:hypothetical protein